MRILLLYFTFSFLIIPVKVSGQPDTEPPKKPVLDLVTVNQVTGYTEISWIASRSTDVAGYVVYEYRNSEGYYIDTIYSPLITSYIHTSVKSSELSLSYVVAAFDSTGNISPLSNVLNTVFITDSLYICNKKIEIKWNSYPSYPRQVLSYTVLYSVNGGNYLEAGTVSREESSFFIRDFSVNSQYCFIVRANLEGELSSISNKICLDTRMQRPPQWINADFATVTPEGDILLTFNVDPLSEISSYILEKKTGSSGSFGQFYYFTDTGESFLYVDTEADISEINYYRLSAFMNNCDVPVTISNVASNIVLSLERNENDIYLTWNPYKEWNGIISSYKLFIKTGEQYEEKHTIIPDDTVFIIRYSDLMYEVTGNEVCFIINAFEASNPYGVSGESRSSPICSPVTETITVPTIFTPDNNLVNDLFAPVLSFTPVDYHLVITDLRRQTVFETRDHLHKWDGTKNSDPVPDGVFLWFMEITAPSGNTIQRTGTVTIIRTSR